MTDRRVTCIVKPNVSSSHEHITEIGNPSVPWQITREEAIRRIENRIDSFFVLDPRTGKRSEVGVVRPSDGRRPFIRTHADGYWNDNPLSLNQCPI